MENFDYSTIDNVQKDFYIDVLDDSTGMFKDFSNRQKVFNIDDKKITVTVDLSQSFYEIWSDFGSYITGKSSSDDIFYDPIDADKQFHDKYQNRKVDYYNFHVVNGTQKLTSEQIRKRTLIFVKIIQMMNDDSIIESVLKAAPKKKNGMLYKKRITPIAVLFCSNKDFGLYSLYAQATEEDRIIISVRKIQKASVEDFDSDLIIKTNLFRDKF